MKQIKYQLSFLEIKEDRKAESNVSFNEQSFNESAGLMVGLDVFKDFFQPKGCNL